MKQRLLKTLALGLLVTGATSAWADDYDGTSAVYSPTNGTNYTTLVDAITAFDALSSGSSFELYLYGDVTVKSRITVKDKKSLTITPKANVSISRGDLTRATVWFLNNSTGTLTIGSSDYTVTIKGDGQSSGKECLNAVLRNESTGTVSLNNVTVQDFNFSDETKGSTTTTGYVFSNKSAAGKLIMKNVTIKDCNTSEDAFISNISTSNDYIYLQGSANFTDCTGTDISTTSRIRLGEVDGTTTVSDFTASTPISVKWAGSTTSIGTVVVAKGGKSSNYFTLSNEALGLFASNTDLKLTQAYTLSVSSAGAATLVLPFESTIPTGATSYTLTYTGGDAVTATEVSGNLSANTPVLVNASEGSYKFVSTATSGDAATGSGTQTSGALTGVYSETTVPSGSYILYNGTCGVGFYKVDGSTNTVAANRAYLTATSEAKALAINYGTSTTGINSITTAKADDGAVYNINGIRMTGTLPKGLYIKNGKKFIVK